MTFTKSKKKIQTSQLPISIGKDERACYKDAWFHYVVKWNQETRITTFLISNEDLGITNDILRYFVADCR